jgi:hypothetical protein
MLTSVADDGIVVVPLGARDRGRRDPGGFASINDLGELRVFCGQVPKPKAQSLKPARAMMAHARLI